MFGLTSFGFEYTAIGDMLDAYIGAINRLFGYIVDLLSKDEWITEIISSDTTTPIIDAVKGVALTLCALFFLMDFFTKSMNLQWVKWENILMFFIKMVFAKVLIDNAPELCEMIYSGFNSVITTALGSTGEASIIPTSWSKLNQYVAFGLSTEEADKVINPPAIGILDLSPMLISIKAGVMGMLYNIILSICFVIVLGRLFELTVYTIIAPIPLATFASDGLHDIGKGFLKSYAAVSIQALVLVIMIIAYSSITNKVITTFNSGATGIFAFAGLINIFALALGVMQSGNWAKRICGAM